MGLRRSSDAFVWFGKELRVVKTDANFQRTNGAKIVKIGGVAIEEIYKRSQPYISQDETTQFILEANAAMLVYPSFLSQIGAAKSNEKAVYEFVDAKGKRFSLELAAVSTDKIQWIYPYKTAPLWLSNEDNRLPTDICLIRKPFMCNFKVTRDGKSSRNFQMIFSLF